jgi:asparagine synthase (glutamine-hydrolysing)
MAAWLTADAREQLAATITTASVPHAGSMPPDQRTAWNELREYGAYQAELDAQAGAGGIPAHAPMLDNAVVRAAMSIPVQQRLSDTVQKPLLNAAFSGILPALLLHRPTKGGYDGSGYAGIQANAARLTAMAARSRMADAGIVDPRPVQDDIARLAAGAPGRMASLETFIAAELWLDWQAQRPRVQWREGAPAHA